MSVHVPALHVTGTAGGAGVTAALPATSSNAEAIANPGLPATWMVADTTAFVC